jgi:hypothetical protein
MTSSTPTWATGARIEQQETETVPHNLVQFSKSSESRRCCFFTCTSFQKARRIKYAPSSSVPTRIVVVQSLTSVVVQSDWVMHPRYWPTKKKSSKFTVVCASEGSGVYRYSVNSDSNNNPKFHVVLTYTSEIRALSNSLYQQLICLFMRRYICISRTPTPSHTHTHTHTHTSVT